MHINADTPVVQTEKAMSYFVLGTMANAQRSRTVDDTQMLVLYAHPTSYIIVSYLTPRVPFAARQDTQ